MSMSRYARVMLSTWGGDNGDDIFGTRHPKPSKARYIKNEEDLYDDYDYGRPVSSKYNSTTIRANHVKNEPDLYNDWGDSYSRKSIELNASAAGGYLAKKSAYINEYRRMYATPDMLYGHCFQTTGFVVGNSACLQISHILIDTGASSSFISIDAANQAGLYMYRCKPQSFLTFNGNVVHDRYVIMELYIAGVRQSVTAHVDMKSSISHNVVVGVPAMKQFDMRSNHCFGNKQETRWSISHNIRGLRRKRYVLRADAYQGNPTMRTYARHRGLRLARKPGETAKERDARETLERRDRGQSRYAYAAEEDFIDDGYLDHGDFVEDADLYDVW